VKNRLVCGVARNSGAQRARAAAPLPAGVVLVPGETLPLRIGPPCALHAGPRRAAVEAALAAPPPLARLIGVARAPLPPAPPRKHARRRRAWPGGPSCAGPLRARPAGAAGQANCCRALAPSHHSRSCVRTACMQPGQAQAGQGVARARQRVCADAARRAGRSGTAAAGGAAGGWAAPRSCARSSARPTAASTAWLAARRAARPGA